MNKNELIQEHPELKLYDGINLIEMRNYKANLKHHQNEGNTTGHLKIIAPFGSNCFNADFYYFTSENEAISEVILRQMGFEIDVVIGVFYLELNSFIIEYDLKYFYLDRKPLNIKSANDLFTLIQLFI
jgi:hypothetical protein